MSSSQFLMWGYKAGGNLCSIRNVANVADDWQLQLGVSRAKSFPRDAEAHMDPDFPRQLGLADNLPNSARLIFASEKLKLFLEKRRLKNVEYLPIAVVNHKRRAVEAPYWIVSPVHPQDCLDLARSQPTYNHIVPTEIDWVGQIVLDAARIDPAVDLFRVQSFSDIVFVRRSLADELTAAGFSGLKLKELSAHKGYVPS